jgi:hypothetical protein
MASDSSRVDATLLAFAEATLRSAGYEVDSLRSESFESVIAVRDRSVVLVGAFFTVSDLLLVEPQLAQAAAQLASPFERPDRYLLLLTSQDPRNEDATPIFDVNYNLQRVRRIVKAGVEATAIGVARAMRAVLPLPPAVEDASAVDPLSALRAILQDSGLPDRVVTAGFERFALEDDGRAIEVDDEGSDDAER